MFSDAVISDCETYRYSLIRQWDESLPFVNFIGLNPSTADTKLNDSTIHKCMRYAKNKEWGYGGIIMTNLFAYRATKPKDMFAHTGDIIGEENNEYLIGAVQKAKLSVAVWGDDGVWKNRYAQVAELIPNLYCLKISASGQPRHPRFLKGDLVPIPYVTTK
jgi:hypothetical protein